MSILLSACGSPVSSAKNELAGTATLTKYYTYGAFFRAEGSLDLSELELTKTDIEGVSLQLRSGSGENDRESFEIPYSIAKTKLTFQTSKYLGSGICLDTLETGDTAAFLELTVKDGETRLLALSDAADQENGAETIEYYTLPYGRGRRKITVQFEPTGQTETLVFHGKRSRLPSGMYDIVIDPGHGGKDPGAISGSYQESDIVLELGEKLASSLKSAGYKVLLTRDGTEDPDVNMAYTGYDEDGRVNQVGASKAKLCLSLHLNYNSNTGQNGVQIYKANKAQTDFASYIADNLVSATDLEYSTMGGRAADGVYVRTFSNSDIAEAKSKAAKKGYTFYSVSRSTDYYFMIREYGALATGAYVDGRNPDYGTNEYRNSLQGVESCLCELGFLSNEHDRSVLLNHQYAITKALTRAVDQYIASLHKESV